MPNAGELIAEFLKHSPFVGHLGMRLVAMEPERAQMELPFAESVVTIGDVVHGGAITALVDTTAMAAAWSAAEVTDAPRGTTVGLTVDFVAAARGQDVTATARVVRRGSSLCFCDVDVTNADGDLVAKGLVTYKIG